VNPKLRHWLFAALGAAAGVYIGIDLADESYGIAVLAALACCWLIVERTSEASPDVWLVAAAVVGYVIGNRGFAQLQPAARIPLLPAEAVLFVAVPALVVRMAMKRAAGVRKDFLNLAILVWAVIGTARLPLDMERYGVIALRDFAMIYYAAFFFISQDLGGSEAGRKVLRGALTCAFVGLLPAVVWIEVNPDFLYEHFTFHGIPVIYHKSDLIGTSLAAGFFWLWTRAEKTGRRRWYLPAAASLLLIALMASPRAAMAAVAVTTALWLALRRWRIAAAQVGIISIASVLAIAAASISGRDIRTSAPYSAFEHAVSIFDPAGRGTYINAESGDPGENNRFRMIWWRDVIDETLETNPVFGLGFGADLATRFLADYDLLSDETFSARSPHSMLVTVFGRMGIAGFLAWVAVSAGLARMVWRLCRRGEPDGMGYACVVCVVWISACFGVVLEGPMGAVVFWTVAGLANSVALQGRKQPAGPETARRGETPFAMAGALDTKSAIR
jgi:hypothetical protein